GRRPPWAAASGDFSSTGGSSLGSSEVGARASSPFSGASFFSPPPGARPRSANLGAFQSWAAAQQASPARAASARAARAQDETRGRRLLIRGCMRTSLRAPPRTAFRLRDAGRAARGPGSHTWVEAARTAARADVFGGARAVGQAYQPDRPGR